MTAKKTAILRFNPALNQVTEKKQLRDGLSVAAQVENSVWLTNDETLTVERLTFKGQDEQGNLLFGDHKSFPLEDYLSLPVPPTQDQDGITVFEEADLEGLDYKDGYLWLVGSHSLKRKKADKKLTPEENDSNLSTVGVDGNRFLLARIPLVKEGALYELKEKAEKNGEKRTAAQLKGNGKGNELTKKLRKDPHLKAFFSLPGKDNGFDIEGLAVSDNAVFLGLRGPVLRGWAVILELVLKESNKKQKARLKIKSIRKHFLQLDGLGVRDLLIQNDDLLILAGPTMELDGPVSVFRWNQGARPKEASFVFRKDLDVITTVPFGNREDHAEGFTLFSADGATPDSLLVVYDSACADRFCDVASVKADIFPLNQLQQEETKNQTQDTASQQQMDQNSLLNS